MPHEWVVASAKQRSTLQDAADSLNALLHLDPIDPAEIHFTLAAALKDSKPDKAKRHVLQALERAPRYLEALQLLEKLSSDNRDLPEPSTPPTLSQ